MNSSTQTEPRQFSSVEDVIEALEIQRNVVTAEIREQWAPTGCKFGLQHIILHKNLSFNRIRIAIIAHFCGQHNMKIHRVDVTRTSIWIYVMS